MDNRFDELTKSLAQSASRRGALKKLGVGLAGMALACFGLSHKATGATLYGRCKAQPSPYDPKGKWYLTGACIVVNSATGVCFEGRSSDCRSGEHVGQAKAAPCNGFWSNTRCSYTY